MPALAFSLAFSAFSVCADEHGGHDAVAADAHKEKKEEVKKEEMKKEEHKKGAPKKGK